LDSPVIQQAAVHVVVKGEVVYFADADPRLPQAEADGVVGELPVGVLLADQSLFFNKSEQFPVADQSRGGVVKEAGDSEDDHTILFSSSSIAASRRCTSCATASLRMNE